MNEHKDARTELIDMLDDLDDRLLKITASTDNIKPIEQDLPQELEAQSSQAEHDQIIGQLGLSAKSMITKIKKAITKMDQGGYGVCIECGQAISAERLQLKPTTEYCLDCDLDFLQDDTQDNNQDYPDD